MKRITTFFLIVICLGILNPTVSPDDQAVQKWDGNRTTPVHLIPLKDEFGQNIVPSEPYPLPYSSRYSCAPCHDYEIIKRGWHFNAASSSRDGRPGEPWVWLDPKTGTVLPLSYRKWKGMWNPQDLGLAPWDFTLMFGRHLPGGGAAEPEDSDLSPDSRWNVSGKIEINCMGCHNASRIQDHSEWAKQVLRQNFRWAATAASGLGEVGGMASRLPETWDIYDGPNPDDKEWAVAPFVRYNSYLFDSKHRLFFDIASKPDDSLCLNCHSVSPVQMKKYEADDDVHRAAGMKCVDCHCNDLSHAMIRGYEAEAEEPGSQDISGFTCRGCHLGKDLSAEGRSTSGRLGAPYPKHSGIPAVHFEKLSCTVCHSGPLPGKGSTRVRTSRANRLAIYGIAQWSTESPAILEPVFIRDSSGKISPHRLIWPAFWGKIGEGERLSPLRPSEVLSAAGDLFEAEERAARILAILSLYAEIEGSPVLAAAANIYELNMDGGLDVKPYPEGKTKSEVFWAVKKNGKIARLVPYFDAAGQALDAEIETRIQKILESLAMLPEAPGKPVLINKKVIYQISEGYLEAKEWTGEAAETPELFWLDDNITRPLASEFDIRTITAIVGHEQSLTEEQVELVLKSLAGAQNQNSSEKLDYFYISGGKMFRIDEQGNLAALEHPAAEPAAWPLGHQVRPAQQSLGRKGCQECHKARSAFFFNRVKGIGPLQTQRIEERSAHSFMGLDKTYQKLFGLSFTVRPLYKVVLFVSAFIIGSILLLVFSLALGRFSGLIGKRR